LILADQPQHLFGQQPVVESLIAQEAIEPGQSRAELDFCQAREMTGDGETAGLRDLTQRSDQRGASLLLRAAKRS